MILWVKAFGLCDSNIFLLIYILKCGSHTLFFNSADFRLINKSFKLPIQYVKIWFKYLQNFKV